MADPLDAVSLLRRRTEAALPGVARSWYVTGSVADGASVETSDVDLVIVLRDGAAERERETVRSIAAELASECGVELDLELTDKPSLQHGVDPQLKLGSSLLHGEDVVAECPLVPIEEWARERMHAAYYLMVSVFGRETAVRDPLDYPDPNAPFLGYASGDLRRKDGTRVPSTRNLVRVSGWMATALLAWVGGQYVVRKRDCHLLYRREIGDHWSDFLARTYGCCREEWEYLVPQNKRGRMELRSICEEMLTFERHYLTIYRRFLIGELGASGDRAERALWVMEQIPFQDESVQAALPAIRRYGDV